MLNSTLFCNLRGKKPQPKHVYHLNILSSINMILQNYDRLSHYSVNFAIYSYNYIQYIYAFQSYYEGLAVVY